MRHEEVDAGSTASPSPWSENWRKILSGSTNIYMRTYYASIITLKTLRGEKARGVKETAMEKCLG